MQLVKPIIMFVPRSLHFQWHITERCNLQCKHCYHNPVFLKKELSLSELLKILDDYFNQIKIWGIPKQSTRISLTGGEPLLRKDFFELLQRCYQNRNMARYGILTNGTLLNKDIAGKLKDLQVDYVQVSLEGDEETNDYIRGKGSFKKIIRAIKLLRESDLKTSISMTVNKRNVQDVPAVVKLAEQLSVNSLGIREFVPLGRGKKIKDLFLSPLEVKSLSSYAIKASLNSKCSIELGCEDGIFAQHRDYSPVGCSAGYASVTVLPNGDVYPCRRLPLFSGNLLKQSLAHIYYNSETFRKLRNLNNINNTCKLCPYFQECHGGGKCINYAYFNNPFAPSPQCWRLFNALPNLNLKWYYNKKEKVEKLDSRWVKELI